MIEDAPVARLILWLLVGALVCMALAPLCFWIADRAAERAAKRRARAWSADAERARRRDFGEFGR